VGPLAQVRLRASGGRWTLRSFLPLVAGR